MAMLFNDIVNRALQLSPHDRGELVHRLIVSLEGESDDSPEAIAKAWDEEVARRVVEMEVGRTQWIPAAEVMSRIHALINAPKATHVD